MKKKQSQGEGDQGPFELGSIGMNSSVTVSMLHIGILIVLFY